MNWRDTPSGKLATALNEGNFQPDVCEGTVYLVVEDENEERPATEEELAALKFDRGFVDAHPEGADRGGYVPFVHGKDGAVAMYDEGACEWQIGN